MFTRPIQNSGSIVKYETEGESFPTHHLANTMTHAGFDITARALNRPLIRREENKTPLGNIHSRAYRLLPWPVFYQ